MTAPAPTEVAIPAGVVAVTTFGMVRQEMTTSLMELRSYSESIGLRQVSYQMVPGSLVEKARNDAVRGMLNAFDRKAGWLLFIDGDMVFAPQSLHQILSTAYQTVPFADVVGGYCVAGNTRILHRHGYDCISDLVGKDVEVFNGVAWSKVRPFQTGVGRKLLRVRFSDGSFLDCTPEHRFAVKTDRKGKQFTEVAASYLGKRHILPSFRVPETIEGFHEPEAYTYGAFLGDGAYYPRSDGKQWRREVVLYPGKHHLPVSGTRGSQSQVNGGVTVTLAHLEETKLAELKKPELPDWVFQMDRESTLAFLAGWFDTDGTSKGVCGDGIELSTIKEFRARGAQLLLRRAGIPYSHVRSAVGTTGYGSKHTVWSVRVPGRAAGMIPGYRVTGCRPVDKLSNIRQVKVVGIEQLPGEHDTYCFTEHERGMGVFGNVLTHQCTLRGEMALPTVDTGTGRWESHFPGRGPIEVIRTGAAFLLIKRHVFERMPEPWFRVRAQQRPLDALLEVDNMARCQLDGMNPFRTLPGDPWGKLEQWAINDPSATQWSPIEVGEDSGFCDKVRALGMRVFVDTSIEVRHVDTIIAGWDRHKEALRKQETMWLQAVGVDAG